MQDKYIEAMEKIQMDSKRKDIMRQAIEKELSSSSKPAKTTRLTGRTRAAIAAAALVITMGILMTIPTTRNVISAGVINLVHIFVPENAVDSHDKYIQDLEEREIPSPEEISESVAVEMSVDVEPENQEEADEISESIISEISSAVESQDKANEDFYNYVTVNSGYYSDPYLAEEAAGYEQQGYSIYDMQKYYEWWDYDSLDISSAEYINPEGWLTEGFFASFWIGDNASAFNNSIYVFKVDEEQLNNYLNNCHTKVAQLMIEHNQEPVPYEQFWSRSTDADGNIVYIGNWEGSDPEFTYSPSDSARFEKYTVTYNPEKQLAYCSVEEGGGVG